MGGGAAGARIERAHQVPLNCHYRAPCPRAPMRQNRNMLGKLRDKLAGTPVEIPDPLWEAELRSLPFLERLDAAERIRLRALCARLLAGKSMTGAAGLELTGAIQLNIALQACLPILHLGIDWYRGWSGIVVYPAEFLVERRIQADDGVVHEYTEPLSGESWQGGPLVLSWADAGPKPAGDAAPRGFAYNVVIHEFAHKLDLLNGEADGLPPFDRRLHPGLDPRKWRAVLEDAFDRFNAELDLIESELPPGIDPESDDADRFYSHLPLDPYAGFDEGEFFAVSSEALFVSPARLRDAFPAWYELLAAFYRQDPGRTSPGELRS
jgi:hypothetical protein